MEGVHTSGLMILADVFPQIGLGFGEMVVLGINRGSPTGITSTTRTHLEGYVLHLDIFNRAGVSGLTYASGRENSVYSQVIEQYSISDGGSPARYLGIDGRNEIALVAAEDVPYERQGRYHLIGPDIRAWFDN